MIADRAEHWPAGSDGPSGSASVRSAVSRDRRGVRSGAVLPAYLAAYLFYLGIPLGSMVLLMAYHLTSGSWGLLIRRILEAAMSTLPLLAVLFVPIALGVGYIYIWRSRTWWPPARNSNISSSIFARAISGFEPRCISPSG